MPNWSASMQQTYEYYIVDPGTWKDVSQIKTVKSSTVVRDSDAETLGSATFDISDSVGECYIRVYLVIIQNGLTERFPLGTFIVQTPSSKFDGKTEIFGPCQIQSIRFDKTPNGNFNGLAIAPNLPSTFTLEITMREIITLNRASLYAGTF